MPTQAYSLDAIDQLEPIYLLGSYKMTNGSRVHFATRSESATLGNAHNYKQSSVHAVSSTQSLTCSPLLYRLASP